MTAVDDTEAVETAEELDARLEVLLVLFMTDVVGVEDDEAEVLETTEEVVDLADNT